MEFMPVFGLLGSFLGGGGKEERAPAPAAVQEREAAPKVTQAPQTAGDKQRAAVRDARKDAPSGSLTTRSGVNIVGGS